MIRKGVEAAFRLCADRLCVFGCYQSERAVKGSLTG